jgi:hypothetical protein
VWSCYALDPTVKANEIFYESTDNARTWKKMPAFHEPHFVSYPHRLRTLRDGTLVLAAPLAPRWGRGTDRPVRAAIRLDMPNDTQMMLFFSFDQGRSWSGPLPVFGGQNVSETDFVELPNGDLLLFNNSIFAHPGRQMVYRSGRRFTPGPLERVRSGQVPETVGLTRDGLLVGCMRPGAYSWSDDLGQTWQPLTGIPERGPEVYQPWMHVLDNGRIACAGHFGADDPIGGRDQYLSIHSFRVKTLRKTKDSNIVVERAFDEAKKEWWNRYTLTLTSNGTPLPGKELEFWYAERGKPGYDSYNKQPLAERMKAGGKLIKVRTDALGKASVDLPHLNAIQEIHYSYQLVVLFNPRRTDADYKPAQTAQLEFYAKHYQDPPLR